MDQHHGDGTIAIAPRRGHQPQEPSQETLHAGPPPNASACPATFDRTFTSRPEAPQVT